MDAPYLCGFRDKKIVFWMSIAVLATVVPQRSEALGGESLGCFVNIGTPGVYSSPVCAAQRPQFQYDVVFHVLGGTGTYGYAWSTNGNTVSSGCTASDDSCILHARGFAADQVLTVSVTLVQGGQTATISASAEIPAVCSLAGQPVDC